jgi:hypothetical protein
MTKQSVRYHSTFECEQRGRLYQECLRLLTKINSSVDAVKLLALTRNTLKTYAGVKQIHRLALSNQMSRNGRLDHKRHCARPWIERHDRHP